MEVNIYQLIEGARRARGITVIIDVFRAFSLEAYLFDMGAASIIPVGDVDLARKLKAEDSSAILAGERHGQILPGFDTGNSPSELKKIEVRGKNIVHTTSAGTQGIANALYADEILGCSLVNARATAKYILKSAPNTVSLVCMGLEAKEPTDEDTLCARYIKSIIENTELDILSEIEGLKFTSGAKFFDEAQNDVFPMNDFYMCTEVDKFNFVMKLEKGNDGISRMKRMFV